jgi:hypothetical protein
MDIDVEMSVTTSYKELIVELESNLIIPDNYIDKQIHFKCGPYFCWLELSTRVII